MVGNHAYFLKAGEAANLVDGAWQVGNAVDQPVGLRLRGTVDAAVCQLRHPRSRKVWTPSNYYLHEASVQIVEHPLHEGTILRGHWSQRRSCVFIWAGSDSLVGEP